VVTQPDVATQVADDVVEDVEPVAPDPEPEPEPEPEPTQAAQEFSGRGDKILQFGPGPFVATITHRGNSNFAVWLFTENGLLQITADGAWTMTPQ
jgi:hypothetical protein